MAAILEWAIVRIRTVDDNVIGGGLLVTEWYVFTCLHIVIRTLGLDGVPLTVLWLKFTLIFLSYLLAAACCTSSV
jgi:hypothetical protein